MVHNFQDDLVRSNNPTTRARNAKIYRATWPNLTAINYQEDLDVQRSGIDCIIETPLRSYAVEEKNRYTSWGDVALEFEHFRNNLSTSPGWVERPSRSDYLLYSTPTSGILFPTLLLQRTWAINKDKWLRWADQKRDGFYVKVARNGNYETWNLVLPIGTLCGAICRSSLTIL